MTEEELREKMVAVLNDYAECFEYEYDKDMTSRTVADQILTLIRESGWKSPEEADFMCDICNMGGQP